MEANRKFVKVALALSAASVVIEVAILVILLVVFVNLPKQLAPVAAQPPGEKTVAELQGGKPFRYVITGIENPTVRLFVLGFTNACKDYQADCVVMGANGFEDSDYIRLVEAATAQGASGMVVGTYGPFRPSEEAAIKAGIPLVGFHTPMKPDDLPGLMAWVATDVTAYGKAAADAMADKLKCAGPIALTQNTFNDVENEAARSFTAEMKVKCPEVVVFPSELEGGDPPAAIAKAGAILTAHPEIKGAFGTTGGSPVTWGKALEQAGKNPGDVVVIGMDYTRQNCDEVKAGWVYAIVGQPIYEENYRAVELLIDHLRGKPVAFDNVYPSPIITIKDLDKYYKLNDQVDAQLKPQGLMGFLRDDDYFLLMDTPPVFPNYPHVGDRSFKSDDFKRVADAGIHATINYVNWDLIEPQRGVYDWSYLDRAVEDALAAGMRVLISDYSFGPQWCPDDWYSADIYGAPVRKWGQLSIWNKEAQDYIDAFVRLLGSRYASERVNLFSTQACYGETYITSEPDNVFYDPAALASFREYTGDPRSLAQAYRHGTTEPLTDAWLRQSILNVMKRRQRLLMEINGRQEIWHSAHHLWTWQGAGAGAKYIRDVLDSYLHTWPGVKINCIQYTYWVHGNNFNYATMLDEDIDKYQMDVYVGAEYCEGLPVYTPGLIGSKLKGFIIAPFSVLTGHNVLEDWMVEAIRASHKAIAEARGA